MPTKGGPMTIQLTLNGKAVTWCIEPGDKLLDVLRREGVMGVKKGCGSGDCGACAVLLNGRAVNSCLILAAKADGGEVVTVEGLADGDQLHPVQEAFLDEGAVQCGYCTPGMVISTVDLLSRNPTPTEEEIREGLSGNLCRCTGYAKQIRAVERAAREMGGATGG
jgi:carbon-monoxide dehydrogenase small subunit